MRFQLPANLAPEVARDLERACIAGGPDNMPWTTEAEVAGSMLTLRREVEESGCLIAPWQIDGAGHVMISSGTLIERDDPYRLLLELARGKVNQLRCQAADWQMGGLVIPDSLSDEIRKTSLKFAKAVTADVGDADLRSQEVLAQAYASAEVLVQQYIEQMFQARHQRQPRLDTLLGCRVSGLDQPHLMHESIAQAFNGLCVRLSWHEVEPEEGKFNWDPYDKIVTWATDNGMQLIAGPLIDFSGPLPAWLDPQETDLLQLANRMSNYIRAAITRYRGIRSWQLAHSANRSMELALSEDELLWLAVQFSEAARQIDPNLALAIGLVQPWGEYMTEEDCLHSPFIFADTLIRAGLNLNALDLEVVMGLSPRGSYYRDLLDTSRLIDMYTLLGVPLRLTLGYPAASGSDDKADDGETDSGRLGNGYDTANQAEWAYRFTALALCKPAIRSVFWTHLTDSVAHTFPHAGVLDVNNEPRPMLDKLRELRENHLR
ncbi:MAG: endo-1,4-beta-xylanase [Gemmataceae bacterium]